MKPDAGFRAQNYAAVSANLTRCSQSLLQSQGIHRKELNLLSAILRRCFWLEKFPSEKTRVQQGTELSSQAAPSSWQLKGSVPACPRRQGCCAPGRSCSGRILMKTPLSVQGTVKSWYSHCQQQSPRAEQTDICHEDRQDKHGLLRNNQNPFLQDKSQPPAKGTWEQTPRRRLPWADTELPGQAPALPPLPLPASGEVKCLRCFQQLVFSSLKVTSPKSTSSL